ncbi:c-type cytochrome [Dyadobacter sandarakinus]|uniref:Cytochrome c n=1 Tax=Dyadobacter sandarakinus TaxID=2747268 RepID=A0ABX7I702_9BACT|nr:cytochrome c [Dyadobacter sandarakinus]QRR01570.1 cytochrome c [Dyadobacter sandarakinus]
MIKRAFFLLLCPFVYACQSKEELKSEQYFAEGYQLFTTHCANCHQADGKGMSNLYPPISGSNIIAGKAQLACIIRNGMQGTISVNGKPFNRPMPANPRLKDLEIAEIITYVNMKWGKDSLYTPVDQVTTALAACKPY